MAKNIERRIRQLTREIADIDEFFYSAPGNGRDHDAFMLERKRDDIVRSAVLQLHTSIEDLLNAVIMARVLNANDRRKLRSESGRALRKILFGRGSIGFDMKLHLAVALRILKPSTKEKLVELNAMRNKCSHNWILRKAVRHGKRPAQKKPPLLSFRGEDLHRLPVLKAFCAEYGLMHAKLWYRFNSDAS